MAMRRPRIKVQANIALNSKRKPKVADVKNSAESQQQQPANATTTSEEVKLTKEKEQELPQNANENTENSNEVGRQEQEENQQIAEKEVNSADSIINANDTTASDGDDSNNKNNNAAAFARGGVGVNNDKTQANISDDSINSPKKTGNANKTPSDDNSTFKCPPKKLEYQRSTSHISNNNGSDDVFYSDIEENAQQMDGQQKSPNDFPMSPSRSQQSRQRIKATPIFGQRRNSFVGSSPSPYTEESTSSGGSGGEVGSTTPRRERHMSGSMSTHSNSSSSHHYHHTPHKYLPNGVSMSRVRTESGCSVFSDSNVSSTHKSRRTDEHKLNLKREFEARFSNGVPDKSALKMSDLIFYNPTTNPMEQKPNPNIKLENGDKNPASTSEDDMKTENDNDKSKSNADKEEAMPVPQLKLNSNGELILDDKSLVIETTAEQEARKVLANSSLIYLDENTGMNGFYSRQKRTRDWPSSETVKFYRCLQTVGTDFSLMVPLFPNRTRRDLKLKFKKEERINGALINKALLYPKNFDVEELKQQIEEEEKQREEEAERLRQLKESATKVVKKRKNARSHADRSLNADNLYQNENHQQVAKKPRIRKEKPETKQQQNNIATTPVAEATPAAGPAPPPPQNINGSQTISNNEPTTATSSSTTAEDPIKTEGDKVRRRRRRVPNIKKEKLAVPQPNDDDGQQPASDHDDSSPLSSSAIKVENVKNEPLQMPLYPTKTEYCHEDEDAAEQIEKDVDLLLHSDLNEDVYDISEASRASNNDTPPRKSKSLSLPITESPDSSSPNSRFLVIDDNYCNEPMEIDAPYEGRTFVNLDDGSFTTLESPRRRQSPPQQPQSYDEPPAPIVNQPTPSPSPPPPAPAHIQAAQCLPRTGSVPQSPRPQHYLASQASPHHRSMVATPPDLTSQDTNCSFTSDRELNEQDIQRILTELAEGSLVLVSTLDPDDPDKVLNEIFMVDKNTGDLCDEPLNIPDNIVQCILSVMS
ncbi:uncharacterized protein DDB_G0284459 [Musca vetustissima]|uniref:uncharacterized protein DDB_G0284459 n=1 Tax=Musca vetustissima TaxID=27455 RepID=UPI002AB6DA48|nr:uncharacterized protein DDB_G0284459 [Musca vetustissima]